MRLSDTAMFQRGVCGAIACVAHLSLLVLISQPISLTHQSQLDDDARHGAPLLVRFVDAPSESHSPTFSVRQSQPEAPEAAEISIEVPLPPNIASVVADSLERARPILSAGDVEEAKRLQGIYVGQIKARLLRLLEASGLNSRSATSGCAIHIIQDEAGRVLDVVSDECNSDRAWNEHISAALRQASPLPMPPQGLAQGTYLTIDLSSL